MPAYRKDNVPREPSGRRSRRNGGKVGRPRIDPDKLANGLPEIRFRLSREIYSKIEYYTKAIGLPVSTWAQGVATEAFEKEILPALHEADFEEIEAQIRRENN